MEEQITTPPQAGARDEMPTLAQLPVIPESVALKESALFIILMMFGGIVIWMVARFLKRQTEQANEAKEDRAAHRQSIKEQSETFVVAVRNIGADCHAQHDKLFSQVKEVLVTEYPEPIVRAVVDAALIRAVVDAALIQDAVRLRAECGRLRKELSEAQTIIATHDLCHDLHGKVGQPEFEEGCRREAVKLFGSCLRADALLEARAEVERLKATQLRDAMIQVVEAGYAIESNGDTIIMDGYDENDCKVYMLTRRSTKQEFDFSTAQELVDEYLT